jgi:hypothetical protein
MPGFTFIPSTAIAKSEASLTGEETNLVQAAHYKADDALFPLNQKFVDGAN